MLIGRTSKGGSQPEKAALRPWRKVVTLFFGMTGMLLLAGGLTALGLYLAGNDTLLMNWLHSARVPLFVWRLTLYAIIAAMWFHRVRAALLRQVTSPRVIYRLEAMMVCLALLIEFTSYRWGM